MAVRILGGVGGSLIWAIDLTFIKIVDKIHHNIIWQK